MKLFLTPLMAAFGLIMSALPAPADDIQISSLPFNITSPGTYVLTGNLTCQAPENAITINPSTSGNIILDLGGYAISAYPYIGSSETAITVNNPTASKIIIRNGTITSFWQGLVVNPSGQDYMSNIHIENITFYGIRYRNVFYNLINSSTISGCTFIGAVPGESGALYGIEDYGSQTGNSYTNNAFDGAQTWEIAVSTSGPVDLEHCHFEVPSN